MKEFNKKQNITCASSFEDVANEILDNFVESFTFENGLLIDIEEDSFVDSEECEFQFSVRAMNLIDRMKEKLLKVGEVHFPDDDLEIYSSRVREY
jgi:hypothetical protein